jgi:hypothetical protein
MGEQQHDGDEQHLRGPSPGVDRGAGTTSRRGETEGPTSTGATTTGQGSTGTAQPPGTPAQGEPPASGSPVAGTDAAASERGAVGDAPQQGDPEVRDADAAEEARRITPGDA